MTPELCLASVPHNGTYFLMHMLIEHRPAWHDVGVYARQPDGAKPTVYHAHCVKRDPTKRMLELSRRMPLLVPLRHPFWVEESWRQRYPKRHIDDDMWQAYHHMLNVLLEHVAVWFPVDATPIIRHMAKLQLEDICGVVFDVDWNRIINSKEDTWCLALEELNPSPRIQEIAKHPIFTQFYGDKVWQLDQSRSGDDGHGEV